MPSFILVSGHPGTGKTTLAKKIIREFNFVYLEKEILNQVLSPNKRDHYYNKTLQPLIFQILLNQAASNLALQNNVLIDSAITYFLIDHPNFLLQVEEMLTLYSADLLVIECMLQDENLLKERIVKRGENWDQARLVDNQSWKKFITQMHFGKENPLGLKFPECYCKIDSLRPTEECFQTAKAFIQNKKQA